MFSGGCAGDVVQFLGSVSVVFIYHFVAKYLFSGNSWQKVFMLKPTRLPCLITVMAALGYKVGRVDQSETALGAEMRIAANKSKSKVGDDKKRDKIVRRCVICFFETVFV